MRSKNRHRICRVRARHSASAVLLAACVVLATACGAGDPTVSAPGAGQRTVADSGGGRQASAASPTADGTAEPAVQGLECRDNHVWSHEPLLIAGDPGAPSAEAAVDRELGLYAEQLGVEPVAAGDVGTLSTDGRVVVRAVVKQLDDGTWATESVEGCTSDVDAG